MKTNIKTAILILLGLFFWQAFAAGPVAVVVKTRGDVRLISPDSKKNSSVKKGTVLYDGAQIKTGRRAFCAVKFIDDKSLLRIKENSSCVIEAERDRGHINKNIVVQVGSFFASLFKQQGRFTVTTPTSVASVKGTKFWTVQFPNGETMYIGIEGLIDLTNDAGTVLLKSGQTAKFTSKNSLPEITITDPAQIPEDESQSEQDKSLEIEFRNENGQTKKLKLELKGK